MENNRLLKKFNTSFWYILYCLPLIILLLTFIGYFKLYKEKGDLISSQVELEIVEVSDGNSGPCGVVVPNTGYIENVYLNTSLSIDEVVSICETVVLNVMDYAYMIYMPSDGSSFLAIAYMEGAWVIMDELNMILYFSSVDMDFGFVGWNPDISYIELNNDVVDVTLTDDTVLVGHQNDKLLDLVSLTSDFGVGGSSSVQMYYNPLDGSYYPIDSDIETIIKAPLLFDSGLSYDSLFDLSVKHTNNSFNGFTLEFLKDGLSNTFNIIGFNTFNNISSFMIMLLAWFIQLMLIHLIVDVLLCVPRLLHDLMERWL